VTTDPKVRANAQQLAADLASLGGKARAAQLLLALAARRQFI